ncbi:hypothetical protein ACS0TY_024280 [Phlomoides rotata]
MVKSPKTEQPVKAFGWAASDSFGIFSPFNFSRRLRNLENVGARLEDDALFDALRACPNLTHLLLLGCEGLRFPLLLRCIAAYRLLLLLGGLILVFVCCNLFHDVHRFLLLRVYMVVFGKLVALETLSIRGVQWCWQAISTMHQMASEVKHLYMKIEFTGEAENLLPFPEIDFVEFFNSHPKLQTFDIHGAMFAATCQKNSLKYVNSRFQILCLEKVVVMVRSLLNAEQKMSTLDSLIRYAENLKKMTIKILQMKSSHSSADEFFKDICRFRYMNCKIVSI